MITLEARGLMRADVLESHVFGDEWPICMHMGSDSSFCQLTLVSGLKVRLAADHHVQVDGEWVPVSQLCFMPMTGLNGAREPRYVACERRDTHGPGGAQLEGFDKPLDARLCEWLGLVLHNVSSVGARNGVYNVLDFVESEAEQRNSGVRSWTRKKLERLIALTSSFWPSDFMYDGALTVTMIGEAGRWLAHLFGSFTATAMLPSFLYAASAAEKAAFLRGLAPRPNSAGWQMLCTGFKCGAVATLARSFMGAHVRLVGEGAEARLMVAGEFLSAVWPSETANGHVIVHVPDERVPLAGVELDRAIRMSLPRTHASHKALTELRKRAAILEEQRSTWAWRSTLKALHLPSAAQPIYLDLVRTCTMEQRVDQVYDVFFPKSDIFLLEGALRCRYADTDAAIANATVIDSGEK
jgi:hypothetical protein